jgi:peroxiredoxin
MRVLNIKLLALLIITSVPFSIYGQESKNHQRGDLAPDFSTLTISGEEISLSDFRGKYVLLNFWGSWCQPCYTALPDLWEAYEEFSDDDFAIIGIALESSEETATTFIESYKIKWPNVVELVDSEQTIIKSYNVQGYPSYYLIDKEGKIAEFGLGGFFTNRLMDILTYYLDH